MTIEAHRASAAAMEMIAGTSGAAAEPGAKNQGRPQSGLRSPEARAPEVSGGAVKKSESAGTRTQDHSIKSRMLYQLSYTLVRFRY